MPGALTSDLNLPRAFLRMCRRNFKRPKAVDSTGMSLTGGNLLLRSLVFRRVLENKVLSREERFVGLLLPPSVPGLLANAAVSLSGRVPVNLNYTLHERQLNSCIEQCGIRHILTSRRVTDRLDMKLAAEPVYLEDFVSRVTRWDKLAGAFATYACPTWLLERCLGLTSIQLDDLATVIFTSGSTGDPKGVMLSHRNIGSNLLAMDEMANLRPDEVFLGVLPFFHAFGYTATVWGVLALDARGAYHYNPLEAETVAKLCRKAKVTFLIGTPTLLRLYLKRFDREDLKSADVVISGAERLPSQLADAWEEKLGLRPHEGYGTTECSPLISVNVPTNRDRKIDPFGCREGSVGRTIPRVRARVVDLDTRAELPIGQEGMIEIAGPNVMQGYYQQPAKTAAVMHDGWYVTGDVGLIDEAGFIHITGRLSRFSKLGGEMVPHVRVEEAIAAAIGAPDDEVTVCVTAIADERKGERLIVLHKPIGIAPSEICRRLAENGLPPLWIPGRDSFLEVAEIPLLGTGKADLKRVKEIAQERFAALA